MEKSRSLMEWLKLLFKGMLMGAADAVPGVSGGTVAFMTGIYEELIDSLRRCGPAALVTLGRQGPSAFWRSINGTFLLVLISGVLLSLVGVARSVLYLLDAYPVQIWSLFFGLILASVFVIVRMIRDWQQNHMLFFTLGTILALVVTSLTPTSIALTPLTAFLGGVIAICAMILPGISGSFLLLLMGLYAPILGAIKGGELQTLLIFGAGCAVGLMAFSRVLHWMFARYHDLTLALLAGFMLGSLNKVWPWKYTVAYTINSKGREVPLVQDNILPWTYAELNGAPDYFVSALALLLLGAGMVLVLEWRSDER
ncbi:MAG: DUF368 domain-containing protein [Marinobacterium sp.]|nr:DUF368 domain-containing protein [Marinobacterium sp.]